MSIQTVEFVGTPNQLAPAEVEELLLCEAVIERGLRDFETMGRALRAVRDKRLYRERFGTFAAYCQARWEMEVRQAQRLMAGAEIVEELSKVQGTMSKVVLPASERHARPLAVLPQGERSAAWREVVATANGGKITVKHVENVVQSLRSKAQGRETSEFGHGTLDSAKPVVVDVREGGDREARLLAAADRAIAPARELVELLGSADSIAAAEAQTTLQILEKLKQHLERVREFQAARAAAQRDERKAA